MGKRGKDTLGSIGSRSPLKSFGRKYDRGGTYLSTGVALIAKVHAKDNWVRYLIKG